MPAPARVVTAPTTSSPTAHPTGGRRHHALPMQLGGTRRRHRGHRPEFARTVVLLPAHNEEKQIAAALRSVLAQTLPVHRVVVIADNCTDRTAEIARSFPVTVMETVGNSDRKSGALNQGWMRYGRDARFVVTMDADTVLAPDCLQRLHEELRRRKRVGGICARPMTKRPEAGLSVWNDLVWRLLALDFATYDRSLVRRKYTTEVLGGFGSMFRNTALHDVAKRHGTPWSPESIVEDYRLSLQLREAGWQIAMARKGRAFTDTPVTLRELWRQRTRWSGGTFEELVRAGWRPWTRRNWCTYLLAMAGVLVRLAAVAVWCAVLVMRLPISLNPIWFLPLIVCALDRLSVSWRLPESTFRDKALAVSVLPLELLTLVGQAWLLRGMWLVLRRRRLSW